MTDILDHGIETVEVAGVSIQKRIGLSDEEKLLIPKVIPHYSWPEIGNDIVLDINDNVRIMLTGHTGTGKTSLFQQIAAKSGNVVLRVNLNAQITVADLVGLWIVRGGEMVWVDGALPLAMKNGYWLILDEIDFAEAYILAALNSVLEPNGTLTLKEKGHEVIIPHKDFRLLSTANTAGIMQDYRSMYQGTNIFNEAFLDRWRLYLVKYLKSEKETKVLADSIPKMSMRVSEVLVDVANLIREAFERQEIQCTFSLRRLIDWGRMMVRHREPMKAAENTIFSKISKEDGEVVKGVIQRVMISE